MNDLSEIRLVMIVLRWPNGFHRDRNDGNAWLENGFTSKKFDLVTSDWWNSLIFQLDFIAASTESLSSWSGSAAAWLLGGVRSYNFISEHWPGGEGISYISLEWSAQYQSIESPPIHSIVSWLQDRSPSFCCLHRGQRFTNAIEGKQYPYSMEIILLMYLCGQSIPTQPVLYCPWNPSFSSRLSETCMADIAIQAPTIGYIKIFTK